LLSISPTVTYTPSWVVHLQGEGLGVARADSGLLSQVELKSFGSVETALAGAVLAQGG